MWCAGGAAPGPSVLLGTRKEKNEFPAIGQRMSINRPDLVPAGVRSR